MSPKYFSSTHVTNISNLSPKYFVTNACHQYLKLVTNARHQYLKLVTNTRHHYLKLVTITRQHYLKIVTNINLQIDDNIQNLKWDSDDCVRFNIDESQIGDLVFDDSNRPWRLWDTAHENKNLPKKIHEASKCYSYDNGHIKI